MTFLDTLLLLALPVDPKLLLKKKEEEEEDEGNGEEGEKTPESEIDEEDVL